jgi:TRAP transporter 4TM/12TM fusion protein
VSEHSASTTERHRTLQGPVRWTFIVFSALAIGAAAYYNFYLDFLGLTFDETGYLFFLLGLFLSLVYLVFPATKNARRDRIPWYDYLAACLVLVTAGYCFFNSMNILTMGWEVRAPWPARMVSFVLLLLVLEGGRRTGGTGFCLVCLFFAAYPLFAGVMPAFLQGKSFGFWRVASYHALGSESIIGIPLKVVGTILIGYMLFAVTLQRTGAGPFFLKLALALLGTVRGGAAKVSIFSSGMMASMSGSVISNVVSTGSFTIPAMKRTGYAAHYAAAVEACASAGGVIMPPIMGATAFVMAEMLRVPYLHIITAAAVPSIMYYFCLFYQADAYAAKNGIKGQAREDCPSLIEVLKEGWFYLVAIALLIYIVVFLWRESQAPWYTTALLLVMTMFRKETRLTWSRLLDLIEGAGKFLGEITAILAACGLIIGAMSITGVAHSFAHEVASFAGDNVALLLILGAICSFVLGMGMTITACYIFLAIVMAPALVQAGYEPLAVHLFIMYWGVASFITPPVALGSFAAASVAGADPMKTGFASVRLGAAKYLLPFFFVLNPALILQGDAWEIVRAITTCAIGLSLIGSAMESYLLGVGRLPRWSLPFLLIAGLLLGYAENLTDGLGLLLAAVVVLLVLAGVRKQKKAVFSS